RAPAEESSDPGGREPAKDLGAGNDRRRQAGDHTRAAVAVELQQIGLQGVEPVDPDATDEQGLDHQPPDRWHPQAILDRGGGDLSYLGHNTPTLLGRKSDIVHQPERNPEHGDENETAEHEGHAQTGLLGDQSSNDRAAEHRHAGYNLATPEYRFQLTGEACRLERVYQPGLHRTGEEREPETDHH